MFTKLAKLLSPSRRKEEGFTLIELLIVVAIIAILAAIAIPQFSAYRTRGTRATMIADAKNTATAFEAYFVDYSTYPTADLTITSTGITTPIIARASGANSIGTTGTATVWTITVTNAAANGSGYTSPVTLGSTGSCSWNSGQNC